jgi:hypothetical protein
MSLHTLTSHGRGRLPSDDFVDEGWFVGNATVETLGRKDAELGLRQIEPAAVLWGVVPFEAFDQPPGSGRKGFVKLAQNATPRVGTLTMRLSMWHTPAISCTILSALMRTLPQLVVPASVTSPLATDTETPSGAAA